MSLPGYQRSRPVNASWLGEVPEHWRTVPLKFVVALRSGGTPNKDNLTYWDGDVPWASAKDLKAPYLLDTEDHIAQKAVDDGISTLVETGSVLVVVRGMILAHTFPVSEVWRPMAINQDLKAVTARPPLRREFLPWLLRGISQITLAQVDEAGHGTKVIRLDRWLSTIVPVPSGEEQVAIAAFLDHETAKIDALVAEQRRLIELLKEKRQAVISHAVTKGLNPDVPMKPSAVDWLGEVPTHWRITTLKHVADIRTGVAKGKDNGTRATIAVPYLRVANVQDGFLDLDEIATIDIPGDDLERLSLRPGDVLMNEGGDYDKLGRGCIWEGQITPCITQNHVFAVRPREISSQWLNAIISAAYAQFSFKSRSKQSTNLASISSTNLMQLPVLLPSADEQAQILMFISRETEATRALVAEADRAMNLLNERRTALISAAVTGQIDVRGLAPSEAA
jgi:type I restriction enzyme S subunit